MDEQLIARFEDAQRRAIALLSTLVHSLEPEMSELAISRLANDLLGKHDFDGWFFPPEVQFGGHTTRAGVWRPPSPGRRLQRGQHVMLALGPSAGQAFGDVGTTVVFGQPDDQLVEMARDCTRAACGYASNLKCVGELFIYARTWANNHQLRLANPRSIGHALLPPIGRLRRGYPRSAHMATWLRRYQVHFLNPRRLDGFWALGPQLRTDVAGARFREVVLVQQGEKRVLGRSGLHDIGRF